MTTHSIQSSKSAHVAQAERQTKSRGAEQKKEAAKKDSVELSGRQKDQLSNNVTYSRETVKGGGVTAKRADNVESVHDLEQVKENIEKGVYDSDDVIDTVVDRLMDDLQ